MNRIPTPFRFIWALWFVLLCAATGNALALPARGTQLNNWCALQPAQAAPPQQSRPYQAAGSACTVCHTSGGPSNNDLNTRGTAITTCTGTGTGTVCGAAVNPFCIATPPSNASITAPPAGTSVAQNQSLTFTAASATNPDGFPLSYNWSFSSGQPAAIGQSVAVPMTVSGLVTATLRVLNSVGMLATGVTPTRAVTVTTTGNQPPVATISSPAANVNITPGGTVNFQGSGTDPNNNLPLTYSWSFPGGSPASSTAQNPGVVTYATAGTFTASFAVTDSLGLASTAVTRTVTVTTTANQPPVASISAPAANVSITPGGTVNFQGSGTDPNNNLPLTYSWSFPGGAPASSTAQNPGVVTYATAGTFTASFIVRDSLGLASTAVTRTVTVTTTANQPPVATISAPAANVSVAPGGTVNFQGSGTDPNNNLPLTYSWSFPGGAPASSTTQNPGAVTYSTAGTYTASFTVRDSLGLASTTVTRTVTVTTTPAPVARIDDPKGNVTVRQGQTVEFQGTVIDSENNRPFTYLWNFGSGVPSTSTLQDPGKARFNTPGTVTVTFTVRNARGAVSAPATRTITVTGTANQPPVATISNPAANVSIAQGGTVNFQGMGSDPDNNLPLTYSWSFPGGTPVSSTAQNPGAVTFSSAGTFTASFTVRDSTGLVSAPVTRTVTVLVAKPVAIIVTPAINVSILPRGTVNFQGLGEGTASLPLTYNWLFPGGSPASSTAQNPGTVRFRNVGKYSVTLTITDSAGRKSDPTTRVVTVAAPNQAPPVIGQCVDNGDGSVSDD